MVAGVELVPGSEVCERLAPDVTRETLRNWTRPHGARPPALQPVSGPRGEPIVVDGEYWYRWPDVVEVERSCRREPRGRPRQRAA